MSRSSKTTEGQGFSHKLKLQYVMPDIHQLPNLP